ncbi:FAD-binding and (Fe-S)-binding domain-containing protein [Microscilla marina]|uniref:D-lactate dehydrogenase n=1 Tax=Microscilla marina ATCC 23134 TaxID=313606 RepID=A1ZHR2_MICM2|nr:FAD-binding and (Fe-S)-binding domain-containing protein [Microscilla marina]EAY30068.1 D-lactate dehydrogenase [Microscilla marina ATCC 23134]
MNNTNTPLPVQWQPLAKVLDGELHTDDVMRTLYATDASAYREMPAAVAVPRSSKDIKYLISFARQQKLSLIPRAAGTSLAGQVVGNGIVVDVSQHMTQVLEINAEERWVRVQPGVIRDDLNHVLEPYGLFFGPETSTANRAMIGGMVGNNSCGTHSVVYGSTREHTLEIKGLLADGSEVVFNALNAQQYQQKIAESETNTFEGKVYRQIDQLLTNEAHQKEIREHFPKRAIPRRNTGYALDMLLDLEPFTPAGEPFNFCKLLCGSEGTLMFMTEIKLHVDPLPPKETGLVCAHFNTIDDALKANIIALQYGPSASELMDHYILECTKANIEHRQNRFFVKGDPEAILIVEFNKDTREAIAEVAQRMQQAMEQEGLGYHFPVVYGDDTRKVWNLRKAGLGLLSNIVGDAKPAPVIEDTAVTIEDLPAYIQDFNEILSQNNMSAVHYAHAGSGELHLRPIINLKTEQGQKEFRLIAEEIARLVKKYQGSLSGEHGDGRLRGEFIEQMVGKKGYELMKEVKQIFDPEHIFNPNKIVETPPMDTFLRYDAGQDTPAFDTVLDFSGTQGILRGAEMCNGSGDCRKTEISGGTMCPSYMATRSEKDTTRARANILREYLTRSDKPNRFDHEEIKEVMDLCLSCKGCKSECPSNVDMAKMKAEFLQQYYDANGVPFRTKLIANFTRLNKLAAKVPWAYNWAFTNPLTGKLSKKMSGFAAERSIPKLHKTTLRKWYKKHYASIAPKGATKKVWLFCDEFTDFNDTDVGIVTVKLLAKLGYEVIIPEHLESSRTYLSKGLLRKAKTIAEKNIALLQGVVSDETPLLGVEPSAILTFRDEYIDLVRGNTQEKARELARNALTMEEFLAREIDRGNITANSFTEDKKILKLHGHCQQKALSSLTPSKKMLSLPKNYEVHLIRSGCCGMAGSFGYEQEHYKVSMQIGELVLFPTVRQQPQEVIIVAAGTSCRHQIKDGTQRRALHPVEVWWDALKK